MNRIVCLLNVSFVLLCTLLQGSWGLTWKHEPIKSIDNLPHVRSGASALANVDGRFVSFGGYLECFDFTLCDNDFSTETHTLDPDRRTWTRKNPPVSPSPRAFFGFHGYNQKHWAILYGGVLFSINLTTFQVYGDLWRYKPSEDTWTQIVPINAGPGTRGGIEIFIHNHDLYLFGGLDQTFTLHNDVWKYNFQQNRWTRLLPDTNSTQAPGGRFIYSAAFDHDRKRLFIYGGNQRDSPGGVTVQWNDTWYYDVSSNSFVLVISAVNANVQGRTHGAAAIFRNVFVVAFGDLASLNGTCIIRSASSGQHTTDQMITLKIDNRSLQNNPQWQVEKLGFSPGGLKRHSWGVENSKLYVTFGFDYQCFPQLPYPNASIYIWNKHTWSLDLQLLTD